MTVNELINLLKEADPSGRARVTIRPVEANGPFLEIHTNDWKSTPAIFIEQL